MNDTEVLKQGIYDLTTKKLYSDNDYLYVYRNMLKIIEPQVIKAVMDFNKGNQKKSAEALGINRNTLRSKLIRYGLL